MDKFKQGEDAFCTQDGKAQDRIPNDLSQDAIQEGTVINAKMVNAWTEEIVNAIKKLGLTPDRTQENQFALGINKKTVYNQVGEVNSWLCSKEHIPKTEAVLDGTLLKSEDYEDGLKTLKKRCPSWISGDNIQLPNRDGYFQRFESSRICGTQGDAMRKVTVKITSKFGQSGTQSITPPGRLFSVTPTKESYGEGVTLIQNAMNHLTYLALSINKATIWRKPSTRKSINFGNPHLKLTKTFKQKGTVASENRPKNFAVIMTVVVGIPRKLVAVQ